MALSSRKEKILQVIVGNYIESCQPISSLEIHQKFFPEVSSATIRNEMSALEEMGYLIQPHISAGRVPTAEAYRLYVNKLLPKRKLTKTELKTIKQYLSQRVKAVEDIVKNSAKIISEMTNLTAVGYIKHQKTDTIKSVKIVKISDDLALFIIVTDKTVLKDTTVKTDKALSDEYFLKASEFLTSIFNGRLIEEVINAEKFAKQIRREYEKIYEALIRILKNYDEINLENISVEGTSKLLNQPEYANVNKAKAMLELLDAKEQLYPILKSNCDMDISIKIGGNDLPECAIITASYSVGGMEIGNAGVIGPIRMDYSKVISVLDYVGKTITTLNEEEGDKND